MRRHGLDVVVEDVRPRLEQFRERLLLAAEEVGGQHLDGDAGAAAPDRTHRRRPVAGAAVVEVVAVDRRHHDVSEAHARDRRGELSRFERVERLAALRGVDGAIAAGARARVSHDLERRRAPPPALADVGAAGLLAHGREPALADDPVQLGIPRRGRLHAHAHPGRPLVGDRAPRHLVVHRPSSSRSGSRSARTGCRRDPRTP